MSAWVLALFSLLTTDPSRLRMNLPQDLAVYLNADPNQPHAPLENMKRELSGSCRPPDIRVIYDDPGAPDTNARYSTLVVLDLRGSCGYAGRQLSRGTFSRERRQPRRDLGLPPASCSPSAK